MQKVTGVEQMQTITKNRSAGRSPRIIPAGREADTLSSGEKIEPYIIASGATICNRTQIGRAHV